MVAPFKGARSRPAPSFSPPTAVRRVYSQGRSIRSGTPLEVMRNPSGPEIDTLLIGWKPAAQVSA